MDPSLTKLSPSAVTEIESKVSSLVTHAKAAKKAHKSPSKSTDFQVDVDEVKSLLTKALSSTSGNCKSCAAKSCGE